MQTHNIKRDGYSLHAEVTGAGPPVVFLHHLGGDNHVWDGVVRLLPDHTCIQIDMRGHGESDVPDGPYTMGGLISDVEAVLDALKIKNAALAGLSVGGMIAQGLAVKRLDLIRALVLCGTAAKFGQTEPWHELAKLARTEGLAALASDLLERWNVGDESYPEQTLRDTAPEGYAATCEAIAGTDFYTPTSGLRLPTLGLCGDRDKSTPPDLVRETTDLIPGSTFELIRGAGHLSPLTHEKEVAGHLLAFLQPIGHI